MSDHLTEQLGAAPMRLEDVVNLFLSGWSAEGPSPDTVRTYGRQLRWLVGFCQRQGKELLADVTPELLRTAMATKRTTPKNHARTFKGGASAAKSLVAATKCLAGWLLAQGVPVNDLSVVNPPKPPEHVQVRLRPHEFNAMEAAILHRQVDADYRSVRATIARDLALLYLLADTGLRASEVCGMTLASIDFNVGAIIVSRGKGAKSRALSIVDPEDPTGGATLRLLRDWIDTRSTIRGTAAHACLWVSFRGQPLTPTSLRQVLRAICEDAGLDGNRPPHAFRRAHFTESYLAEPDAIEVLTARMGWAPTDRHMIEVYTRGAQIDLAMTTPLPSVSGRWRRSARPQPATPPLGGRHWLDGRPARGQRFAR